ncbi:MAG: lactococcin 972 family bacteriocin [Actinobacteria bacterium]|nr:lactococcin 972 family bacteriocin [Actinomycetota bacterium]
MKAVKKVGIVAAITAALALVPVGVAAATTVQVGGGLWSYGTTTDVVYSNYHHGGAYHSATACNQAAFDKCHQSAAAPGAWANASNVRTLWGNTAYWNTY